MELSDGQNLGITQLKNIQDGAEYSFEIIGMQRYKLNEDYILIETSLFTKGFVYKNGGFNFRPRERLQIFIPKEFPYELPRLEFYDYRYFGKPHVHWWKEICLYQSVEFEWDPGDGMFGYMDRLHLWFQKAALGELDPPNEPLHPPVAYVRNPTVPTIVANTNAVEFDGHYWLGACAIEKINDNSSMLNEWIDSNKMSRGVTYAATVLVNNKMPFEYPFTLDHLLRILNRNDVDVKLFLESLGKIALHNGSKTPLFIVVGSLMRGVEQNRKQHLAVWYLEEKIARNFRSIYNAPVKSHSASRKAQYHIDKLIEFSKKSLLAWCSLLENRPEIIVDRDTESQSRFFKDKKIEIWGCGALGSHIAEIIARSKPKEITLYDNGIVKPGILVRQLFYENDIGINKALALKSRLERIYSNLTSVKIDTDLISDTTASLRVFRKLDKAINDKAIQTPIVSYVINYNATKAMGVIKSVEYNSGTLDIIRKAKLQLCNKENNVWLSDFFPKRDEGHKLIQPEPGCSDPTFIGSEADLSVLSGLLINQTVKSIIDMQEKSKVLFISQELDDKRQIHFDRLDIENHPEDQIILDPINDYKILIPNVVLDKIIKEIAKSDKKHNPAHETGGLIFGEWDDLSKVVYLTDVSGPPSDSKSSPAHFESGVIGTKEKNEKLKSKYQNSVYFVGLWHSHPFGTTQFSGEDKVSMQLVVTQLSPPKSLLLIVAYDKDRYSIGGFVFNKSQFS
jgi:hypothetical protein